MRNYLLILLIPILAILSCRNDGVPAETKPLVQETQASAVEDEKIYQPKLPTRIIEIAGYRLRVEIADEQHERNRGLMFRNYLPDTAGMLFIFDEVDLHPFWMKNTFIPLSIAFIDEDFVITDIKWMKPHDTNSHYPSKPIKYTVEVNQGWFLKRDIKPGMKVNLQTED